MNDLKDRILDFLCKKYGIVMKMIPGYENVIYVYDSHLGLQNVYDVRDDTKEMHIIDILLLDAQKHDIRVLCRVKGWVKVGLKTIMKKGSTLESLAVEMDLDV